MDMTKTVFGDLRKNAAEVVRVQTEGNVYFVAFHEERGRKYVIVRGAEGSDRENVVVRDSDPRIGDDSMFEVPLEQWRGKVMEAATMRTSPITSATLEADPTGQSFPQRAIVRVGALGGLSDSPAIVPVHSRGTHPGSMPVAASQAAQRAVVGLPANMPASSGSAPATPPQQPYPLRHVLYAEDVTAYLRSIARRDHLFEDLAHDQELTRRLIKALEDSEDMIKTILRRARR